MKRRRIIARDVSVHSLLGSGSNGETLLVSLSGSRPGVRWVLKWLRSSTRRDLAALASLSHPALAMPTEFRVDADSGRRFLLRPFISGSDLAHAVQTKTLKDILSWMTAATDSVRLLHDAGFAHANLKLSNLIVPRSAGPGRRTGAPRVMLCDPATGPLGDSPGLGGPALPGGPFAADVFALGRIFYFLITRQEPRASPNGLPVPLVEWSPDVPTDLDRILSWALHPEPERRCPDAAALSDALRELAGERAPRRLPALEHIVEPPLALDRALDALRRPVGGRVVVVMGEARAGKSSLLRRLELEAQLLGHPTARLRCYPEAGPAAQSLKTLLSTLIPRGPAGRKLRSRLTDLFAERDGSRPEAHSDAARRKQLLRALWDLLAAAEAMQPVLLFIDDAHEADPLLIELLAGIVDGAGASEAAGHARQGLVIAYRSEPPYRTVLRPLIAALGVAPAAHVVLELPRQSVGAEATSPDLMDAHRAYLAALGDDRRVVLEALAILARPCEGALIARIVRRLPRQVAEALIFLEEDGATRNEGGMHGLRHGSSAAAIVRSMNEDARRVLHRRTAAALAQGRVGSAEEAAHHWLESDTPARGLKAAMQAARELARQHEDRRALPFFRGVLDLLPERSSRRRSFAIEAADAHASAGEQRRAVEILSKLLPQKSRTADDGRLHARLGVLLHRSGEAGRAAKHLGRALELLAPIRGVRGLRERLRIECELAEIAINRGEYTGADAICRRALDELGSAGSSRGDKELLRSEMVLLETQAHLHMRCFELEAARVLFEKSLEVGERAGAAAEQSLTLNNLGIIHIQENRFREALACYERAESISLQLADDSGLAAIHCNLAVIHAKLGDADAAGAAMERASFHEGRCDSVRTRFLRLHSAAMVDLLFGRLAAAISGFRDAITMGEELKDLRMVAFDLVYLAECHIHRGEARESAASLDRSLELSPALTPLRRMVEARRALLAAMAQDGRSVRVRVQTFAALGPEPLSYLDAWNRFFVGWAQRLVGDRDAARGHLEGALAFFEAVSVPCGVIQASLELAALDCDRERHSAALARITALRSEHVCGKGALRSPMLSARLLAYHARVLLDQDPPALQQAAVQLSEAERYLIGRRFESLETGILALKRRLRAASVDAPFATLSAQRGAGEPRDDLLLLEALERAAVELVRRCELEVGLEKAADLRSQVRALEERVQEARRVSEERPRRPDRAWGTSAIVGRSSATRELVALIRKLAPLANPILIRGETGSGKELVARALHAESPRREMPFVSVSCTALPGELLEAELFGFVRGSFSGAEEDRAGLLRAAAGGTFLFDDIGEMPLELQAKLIRVLDPGSVRPLGSEEEIRLDVRCLFITSQDLQALARERRFRPDLLFRLGGLEVAVPPLRDRLEDLPLLVDHFLAQGAGDGDLPRFERDAVRALEEHSWPGNVRELENLVTRLSVGASGLVRGEDVRRCLGEPAPKALLPDAFLESGSLPELQAALERKYIVRLYRDSGGDVEAVARALGIKVRALFDRLRRLRLRLRDMKAGREGPTRSTSK